MSELKYIRVVLNLGRAINIPTMDNIVSKLDMIQVKAYDKNAILMVQSVEIPEGIEIIDVDTFRGMLSLISVKLPESIKVIRKGAFRHCFKLESINFPDGLGAIEDNVFRQTGLRSVNIKNSDILQGNPFSYCCNLKRFTMDGKTFISENGTTNIYTIKQLQ